MSFEMFYRFFQRTWPNVLFFVSVDGVFLWSFAAALGDGNFSLVDPYFMIQLQFKLAGYLVLSWALALVLANIVRVIINSTSLSLWRKLKFRKTFRFCLKKYQLEIVFLILLFVSSLTNGLWPLFWLLLCFIGGWLIRTFFEPILRKLDLVATGRRIDAKVSGANSRVEGLRMTVALLTREVDRREASLEFLFRTFFILCAIFLGVEYSQKLKLSDDYVIISNEATKVGAIIGQTSFGFLMWEESCECLVGVGFDQMVSVARN